MDFVKKSDIVIHSGTKFLGGHNDTLAGFIVTNNEQIKEKLPVSYLYPNRHSLLQFMNWKRNLALRFLSAITREFLFQCREESF